MIGKSASYEPEIFPGLIVRKGSISLTAYYNGKIVLTGSTSVEKLNEMFNYFTNKLIEFNCKHLFN